jgi:2-polyprenyl-6-methoxyphenol hydroxylase-like FAD-dependent oxidoreductase
MFLRMTQDVLVVGAGPVGLFLAIELATAGVRPLVLERLLTPDRSIKSAGVGVVGAEALERRGLGPALAAAQSTAAKFLRALHPPTPGTPQPLPGGHFSGLALIDQRLQADPERHMRLLPQEALERLLEARVRALGVEIRRGVTVGSFVEDEAGVLVETSAGPIRTRYLVGCDGGRSGVRKLAGFAFVGTDPTLHGYQAVVELDRPELLPPRWERTPRGFVRPMPGGRVLVAELGLSPVDRRAPVTEAELQAVLQRVSGTDVRVLSMAMATRWTDHARQASRYRTERGRILLAGDAAHVHSPFGGQGLNLGLVDAANLGFKLASAVQDGRDDRLDSYTAERHPVGAAVLENTRAQVALMRPDPHTSALRGLVADLMKLPEANRFFGEMLTGVGVRYDLGDDEPEVGTLAKDRPLELVDGSERRLFALMEAGGGLFVSSVARPLPKNVRFAHLRDAREPARLLRPDGCVAWTEASTRPLDEALQRWF